MRASKLSIESCFSSRMVVNLSRLLCIMFDSWLSLSDFRPSRSEIWEAYCCDSRSLTTMTCLTCAILSSMPAAAS